MKRNASVTVFLALVITCSSALICALTESARTAGARFYVNAMAGSAIDSLFSQYHPQLWECYRLLGCAYRSDAESAQEMQNFMKPYVEDCGWYAISAPTALVTQKTFMTDGGGVWFEQEVLDYLKSGWINLQLTPESAEKLWKQLKEAQAMNEIIRDYGMESREAASMEKALDRINKNLEKQTSLKRSARGCLNDWSNTRFQREASQLETTVRELPELIRKFDTKAERFASRMQTLEEKHRSSMELLEPENREVIEDQIKEYHEYTDANGLRRQKIDALDDNNENELRTITEVRDFADETEEYIDSYESDDEDDEGPDEDELWGEVADAWDCVPIPETDEKSGIASEKTVKDLEGILDMVNDGFLKCVVPKDREVSEKELDTSLLPSRTSVTDRDASIARDLMAAVTVDAYAGKFLTSFTDNAKERPLLYELEYVVAGKDKDQSNLSVTVLEILAIREAANFLHIMTDPEKHELVQKFAAGITAGGAIPALTILLECLIVAAWALMESIMDLRLLLQGKKAALFKTKEDWMIDDVADIFALALSRDAADERLREAAAGFTYEGYLQMLLFLKKPAERDYRIMDVIQTNIRLDDQHFLMKDCLYGLHVTVDCESRHLFTMLGISGRNGLSATFPINTEAVKAY